jgi:hypothetical protein
MEKGLAQKKTIKNGNELFEQPLSRWFAIRGQA